MYITPESFQHSRGLFIKDLPLIHSYWKLAKHSSLVVSDKEDLTIDWISADAIKEPKKLFFLSTGLHGIEGYLGSIMMQLFVNEFLPLLNPLYVGILLVHCINPSGMQRRYRTNSANVDLNRNFIDNFKEMSNTNPDYPKLDSFFNPKSPLRNEKVTKFIYALQTIKWLTLFGPGKIREAALMGQYNDPSGMYFGGLEYQPETKFMMNLIDDWIPRHQQTLHLDMHTGYGPRYQMTLVQTPSEPMTSLEAQEKFNVPLVAATNPEEFYQIHGEMADYLYQTANKANKKIYSAAFEFGTYGSGLLQGARSLLTTIAANQAIYNQNPPLTINWLSRDYNELYFPSEPSWLDTAIHNGRQAFRGILEGEGFI
ncbi:MAG: M14 family metallopeptidase [Chloroflexota bacterium]